MTDEKQDLDIATLLVHEGERRGKPAARSVSTPIYASSTFTYDSMAEIDQVFEGEKPGYVYTRHGNPTVTALEDALRSVEGGAVSCAYSSGMAAIHAALFACELTPGATVLASQDLYGATTNLLLTVFGSFGIKTVTADFSDLDEVRAKASETKPRGLIAETISNPLLKICDIAACVASARTASARLIIDNTFATPYLCRPLEHGADIVVHSATKFIGGHSTSIAGVLVEGGKFPWDNGKFAHIVDPSPGYHGVRFYETFGDFCFCMKVRCETVRDTGACISPFNSFMLLQGLETLSLRMDRHCQNGLRVTQFLQEHSAVSWVRYPGLPADPSYELAKRYLPLGA